MANVTRKPGLRPANPLFSSGPCAKRPGWTLAALEGALLGRSHRAKDPKARLAEVIERSKAVLGMPADWRLGIVPASDTGAVEMVLWSMLGARGVDVLVWESFSKDWATDVTRQLKLADARTRCGCGVQRFGQGRKCVYRHEYSGYGPARFQSMGCRRTAAAACR